MRLSSRPPSGTTPTSRDNWVDAWLRDGYYVLMRTDPARDANERQRIAQAEWDLLALDPGSGVIYRKDAKDKDYQLYTGHSYLVFTVQTGFDSSQLDLAQEAAELGTVIAAYSAGSDSVNTAAASMSTSITESIKKLSERKAQQQKARDLK